MKRLIKRFLKGIWNLTGPIRRPIARRVDARLHRIVAQAIESNRPLLTSGTTSELQHHVQSSEQTLCRIESSLNTAHAHIDRYSTEVDLVLNSLIREIARLQLQVDHLQDSLESATRRRGSAFLVVDGSDGHDEHRALVG